MLRCAFVGSLLLGLVGFAAEVEAALFLHWDMNGTPSESLMDSVGTNHLLTTGVDSDGGAATLPTYLPTGGVNGSGAYHFNSGGLGADLLRPTADTTEMHPGMPEGGGLNFDWTASFWIKTEDTAMRSNGGSTFAFQLPILGERNGAWAFELGIDGGKAGFFHWDGNYFYGFGDQNVADGEGHYVTFVHKSTGPSSGTFDIFIDGLLDVAGLDAHDTMADLANPRYRFRDVGRMAGDANAVGEFILDDVRLFDTALSSSEILTLFGPPQPAPVPEPGSYLLLSLGLLMLRRNKRRC